MSDDHDDEAYDAADFGPVPETDPAEVERLTLIEVAKWLDAIEVTGG